MHLPSPPAPLLLLPGGDYSTTLAPWLAHGCISPRTVYADIKRYERQTGTANKSTYWVVFELIWRDFYRFFALKHGNAIFLEGGTTGQVGGWSSPALPWPALPGAPGCVSACATSLLLPLPAALQAVSWSNDGEAFRRWKEGTTGWPLVDANMRELAATGNKRLGCACRCMFSCSSSLWLPTAAAAVMLHANPLPPFVQPTISAGFMSNRGRQNVASFLALDLGVDWQRGADWFESLLMDYDVCRWAAGSGGEQGVDGGGWAMGG